MTPDGFGVAVTALSFIEAVLFVVLYARRMDIHDRVAWHIIVFVGVLALLLGVGLIRIFTNSSPDAGWFTWLRVGLYTLIPLVLGWRLLELRWSRRDNDQ